MEIAWLIIKYLLFGILSLMALFTWALVVKALMLYIQKTNREELQGAIIRNMFGG